MFTQCVKCETVFRLSADALRAAGGQVRCGRCGEVFNALSRLAENATAFTRGESPLFLETRAAEILESSSSDLPAPPHVTLRPIDDESSDALDDSLRDAEFDLPPGAELAQLRFIGLVDDALAEENSLEFTLPPAELDRIFVDNRSTPLHPESSDAHPGPPPAHPESPGAAHTAAAAVAVAPPVAQAQRSGLEVSDQVRQDVLSSLRADLPTAVTRARLPPAAWLIAAIVLGILLVIQLVRGNSDWLAVHMPLLGVTGTTVNLSVYQLRQWGVTGDPGAKGTLRVRASIMNTAPQLQPYPLLRVTLANRFGTHVGARDFEPAEYLGHAVVRQLAPGERVDATLDIVDPGKDAEGFEIDVCLRNADQRVMCAADAVAQTK